MSNSALSAFNDALLEYVDKDQAVKLRALINDARGRDGLVIECIRTCLVCLGCWIVFLIFVSGCYVLGTLDYGTVSDLAVITLAISLLISVCLVIGYDNHLSELKDRLDKIIGGQ